jgi:proline-specific peptidase
VSVTAVEGRIPFRGHETWYRAVGGDRGAPLLCLHGGPGGTHLGLRALEPLADERKVVLYDQLGGGYSTRHGDRSLMTVETFVDEVHAVRLALGLDRVHLLGYSWGGMLALEYALTRPAGVESLILSSTLSSSRLMGEESLRLRTALPDRTREVLDRHERDGTTHDPAYEEAAMVFYRRHLCRLDPWPSILERIFELRSREVYEHMWGPSEFFPNGVLLDWDVTPRLAELRVPTLVTCGEFDEATPRLAEVVADGIPGAERVVLEGVAHMAPIEDPETYLGLVRDFLSRVDAQATPS